jgi:nucleoside-diphosphate-sugar epimerase
MPSTAGITELSPKTLYAEQKVVTLNSIKELLVSSEIRFTWARVFHPYGPTQDPKRLIPYLIEALRSGRPIKLVDTTSFYDWVSVRDIASAISWVITNRLSTEIDIGTTFGYSNLELLNTLIELLPNISQDGNFGPHEIGLGEVFIVGKDSPLIKSGWLPNDSLKSGLEWVLST